MKDGKSPQVIFQAINNHGSSSGTPPYRTTDVPGHYFGYFENEHREQFVFVYDYNRKSGTLWMGDYGWANPIEVIDGNAPEVMLSIEEQAWLHTCWNTATAFEKK